MWENEHKKYLIRNATAAILLLSLTAGLIVGIVKVNQNLAQQNAVLSEQKTNQEQKINEDRESIFDEIAAGYEKDMATVAQYLPGIVCWGDSLTTGAAGGVSYPDTLQTYINEYLCKAYDFRGTVENPVENSRINWDDYTLEIPVVNMGGGQENAATVQGRCGVLPFKIKRAVVIPADCEPVEIVLENVNNQPVNPLSAGSSGINPVVIDGVEGTLTLVGNDPRYGKYQFTRQQPGNAVEVPEGTEITTAASLEYENYIHIVWVGTFGYIRNNDELVDQVKSILARQTENTDRYLVLGLCSYGQRWEGTAISRLESLDSAMLQAFGDHYINVRKYLVEDGMRDAGFTESRAANAVNTALRSNTGSAELNSVSYRLVGRLVYERMNRLGYFDEIRKELEIPADYVPGNAK